MTFQPSTILYVPDAHIKRGDDLDRFYALRRWVADRGLKLDHIIQGGDLWDMEAFCLHDQANPEWYDRHFWDEFERGFVALDLLEGLAKTSGRKGCSVSVTEGNHEHRYTRYMASDNRLRSSPFPKTCGELLKFYRPKSKIAWVPFQQTLLVGGIAFSHYFVSGLMNRPQGGERPAGTILKAQHHSCVCGHSHTLDFAERTRADGSKIFALVGGCFVNPQHEFGFAGAARKLWWNGFHVLHNYAPGEFDVESINLSRI